MRELGRTTPIRIIASRRACGGGLVVDISGPRGVTRCTISPVRHISPLAGRLFGRRTAMAPALGAAVAFLFPSLAAGWAIWTPSRNIMCGAERGSVICQILHQDVSRGARPCGGLYSFVGVVKSQGTARLRFGCYSGVSMSVENAETVADGDTSMHGGVTCRATATGLRCANRSRHGFFLSPSRVYRF